MTDSKVVVENVELRPPNIRRPVGWQLTKFGKDKPAIAGPGRPRIPESQKELRRQTQQILLEAAPFAAERLMELARSETSELAVRACIAILNKSVPDLEEINVRESDPEPSLDPRFAQAILDAVRAGADQSVRAQN